MIKTIITWIVMSSASFAVQNSDLFVQANDFYKADNFEAAIQHYNEILITHEHEDIYYNLGNSYFRNGEIGKSIWAFEKAFRLDPRDSDIIFNLRFLKSLVRDRIIAPEDIFFVALYKAVIEKFTLSDLILITGFFTLLISLRYSVNEFSKISKSVNSVISYGLAVALIFSAWITFDKYWSISDRTYGIILSPAVDVRSAPIMRGQNVVFRIHEGTKVEIQHSELGWNEIILLDGKKGWVLSENLKAL